MKTAVVDVGGGMRGVYASGVLDRCLKENIQFDLCIGVSAGSANLASYLSGQMGRNLFFYHDYAFRKEYMSLHNFFHTHSYVDLEYIYATLSNQDGENALNYSSLLHHPAQFWVVAEEAVSGKPRYFNKGTSGRMTTASSWHPPVCRGSIVRFCSTVCCTTTVRWQTRSPSKRRLTLVVTVSSCCSPNPAIFPVPPAKTS